MGRAGAGDEVTVLSATWAEGTVRADELREAPRLLGAGEARLLGYADAAVPASAPGELRLVDVPLDEAAGRLAEQLVDLAPDVVVTHDRLGGATGHEDHRRTHEVVIRALELASTRRPAPAELRLGRMEPAEQEALLGVEFYARTGGTLGLRA